MTTKTEIRNLIRQRKLTLLSEERRGRAGQHLLDILQKREDFCWAKTILLYSALPDEVPTQDILREWGSEKQILLPTLSHDGNMRVKQYDPWQPMQRGAYQILEPQGEEFTDWQSIDLALIPGVAFDLHFHRCGRGKGYYDRFLAHPHLAHVRKVGVAFDFQLIPNVPIEPHDQCLHDLILLS